MSSCYVLIDTANLKNVEIQNSRRSYVGEVLLQTCRNILTKIYRYNTDVMYDFNVPWFIPI